MSEPPIQLDYQPPPRDRPAGGVPPWLQAFMGAAIMLGSEVLMLVISYATWSPAGCFALAIPILVGIPAHYRWRWGAYVNGVVGVIFLHALARAFLSFLAS